MKLYFQWLTDEKLNNISVLKNIELEDGDMYLNFIDGSRCNKNFVKSINEQCTNDTIVVQVESPNNLWYIKKNIIDAKPERWEKDKDGQPWLVEPAKKGKEFVAPKLKLGIKPYYEYSVEDIKDNNTSNNFIHTIDKNSDIINEENIKSVKIVNNTDNKPIPSPISILCEKSKKTE
ncbi:MAG: hypothetical protein RSF67_09685, partial [Clostridia bacterium]